MMPGFALSTESEEDVQWDIKATGNSNQEHATVYELIPEAYFIVRTVVRGRKKSSNTLNFKQISIYVCSPQTRVRLEGAAVFLLF